MHYNLITPTQNQYSGHKSKEPNSNQSNLKYIQNHEIKCSYKINMSNYYRNVHIYNHKRKIIIYPILRYPLEKVFSFSFSVVFLFPL